MILLSIYLQLTLLVLLIVPSEPLSEEDEDVHVVYSWRGGVPVNWPNSTIERENRGKRVIVIGIKVWRENIYLTVPRWSGNGIAINVATLPTNSSDEEQKAALNAWPSWEMQELGNCDAFQYVQSMEVEKDGTMWLADNGREFETRNEHNCAPKLIIMDIESKQVSHTYEFPSHVVNRMSSFLNDITLDLAGNDEMAYISDSKLGRLVVYSRRKNKSWTIESDHMKADINAAALKFVHQSSTIRIPDNNINGVAVSPLGSGSKWLYFSPLTSTKLFRVRTAELRNYSNSSDLQVETVLEKPSQSDGFAMGNDGYLFIQELTNNAVSRLNTSTMEMERLVQDNSTLIWPDTFALDSSGGLWVTTRGWPVDSWTRIVRIQVDSKPFDYQL